MTAHLATHPADRRKYIATLREMVANFAGTAEGHEDDEKLCQAQLWWRRACAIRWALNYVARHVDETGHLTISLDEPEEVA
jgi:hypothetical protein